MCLALSCWSIVPRTGCLGVSGLSRIRHTSTGLALSLCGHDQLDEVLPRSPPIGIGLAALERDRFAGRAPLAMAPVHDDPDRSEEHTSELQSRSDLVCRLRLE